MVLSFVIAVVIFVQTYAVVAKISSASSYITFTTYDHNHHDCTGTPMFVAGLKLSTCEYDSGASAYTGNGNLVSFSAANPAPGQVLLTLSNYAGIDEIGDLICPVDKWDGGNVRNLNFAEDTCTDSMTAFAQVNNGADLGMVVVSESGFATPMGMAGVVATYYHNTDAGKQACSDAEAYGASSFVDNSVVGFQWFPTGFCNDVSIVDLTGFGGDYFNVKCNADGSFTFLKYGSEDDCKNDVNSQSFQVPAGNGACTYDWSQVTFGGFTLLPYAFGGMYNVNLQCVTGMTPKPAPKVKMTKSPSAVKKGKKMM